MVNSKRPEFGPVAAGDEMIVTERSNRTTRVILVTVLAVGRTWFVVEAVGGGHVPGDGRFHMTTRTTYAPGKGIGSPPRIRTPEQYAWDERESAAREYLRDIRVEAHGSQRWRDDLVTLANLIRDHEGLDLL